VKLHCGINLGHDAGLCICDDAGLTLIELERLIGVKHACGSEALAPRALKEAFEPFEASSDVQLAFSDYFTSRSTLVPPEVIRHADDASRPVLCKSGETRFLGGRPRPSSVVRHHFAHAASAYYTSTFDSALILCLDGIGSDDDCGFVYAGQGNRITPELAFKAFYGPRFGLLYEAATRSIFGSQFDTGKLMGLAAYGKVRPQWVDCFRLLLAGNAFRSRYPQLLDVVDTGNVPRGVTMNGRTYRHHDRFGDYFGEAIASRELTVLDAYAYALPSAIGDEALDFDGQGTACRDVAATIQHVFEAELLRLVSGLRRIYPQRVLCYAGGCALNINANSLLLEKAGYDDIHIPSCCNDSGVAAGAALASYHASSASDARPFSESGASPLSFAGPRLRGSLPSRSDLASAGLVTRQYRSLDDLLEDLAAGLAQGKVVGWICGRMETGPRALGRRSLLASPLVAGMKKHVSEGVKGREWFRPIAPIAPASEAARWFEGPLHKCEAMLFAVRTRGSLPEVTHADGTARLQTVDADTNPELSQLLERFGVTTGTPVLMNTSLNAKGQPIVNNAAEATAFLARSGMDALVFVDDLTLLSKGGL
jgi:carbamoyltransferase